MGKRKKLISVCWVLEMGLWSGGRGPVWFWGPRGEIRVRLGRLDPQGFTAPPSTEVKRL